MDLDPVLLSRLQFAWVIGWHILLPAFTVGMASYIAILEGMHLVTGRSVYLRISMYWIRIFSVAFGVGVVALILMKRPRKRLPMFSLLLASIATHYNVFLSERIKPRVRGSRVPPHSSRLR